MTRSMHGPVEVADFRKWHLQRQKRGHSPLARYALDKCEEAYRHSEWDRFGYWFEIYRRERPKILRFDRENFLLSD